MLRFIAVVVVLIFAVPTLRAQEEKSPVRMPSPKGWAKETIALPPGFAKDMTWKGTEEIRFAPGMFKADSDSFFSYVVLFWLPADAQTDRETIEREVLTYYRGLAKTVGQGKKGGDVGQFKFSLKPEGADSFVGDLQWSEPFVTGKEQKLRIEATLRPCAEQKHQMLILCVSPQPVSAAIWKEMRTIRDGCKCP